MNIFNSERKTLRARNKNLSVTPSIYSLKNLSKLQIQKLPKAYHQVNQRVLLNLLRNKTRINISNTNITTINPAFTKITTYLSKFNNNSNIVNNFASANQLLALNPTNTLGLGAAQNTDNQQLANSKLTNPMGNLALQLSKPSQLLQDAGSLAELNLDPTTLKDLSSKDPLTKGIAELTVSSAKTTKLAELHKQSFSNQFNLRKYLKSLYTFNPSLAFNKNILYNFNKTNPSGSVIGTSNALKDTSLSVAATPKQSVIIQGRSQSDILFKNVFNILRNSFLSCYCLISKPVLEFTPKKVVIKLFYYNFGKLNMVNSSLNTLASTNSLTNKRTNIIKDLELLCSNLSKLMKTSVVLDLVELKGYQLDGTILANSIGIITDKLGRNFRKTINNIFKKTIIINPAKMNNATIKNTGNVLTGNKAIASYTGINIRLAGRLSRQSIIPRKTVKLIQRGSLARRYNDFLTVSNFTAKNRRGIFCYTITIGHRYY